MCVPLLDVLWRPPREEKEHTKKFSKMISVNVKSLGSMLLAEPHVTVMFSCRTLTRSARVCCRTLQVAELKALNFEKDSLAEPCHVGSFRICPRLESERSHMEHLSVKSPALILSKNSGVSLAKNRPKSAKIG